MSTYEEFQIILGVAMLIVAILNLMHRKNRPYANRNGPNIYERSFYEYTNCLFR